MSIFSQIHCKLLFYINLKLFFKEFWTYFHRIIAVMGKRVKIYKIRFKSKNVYRSDLKKFKIIEISLFVTEICQKNIKNLDDFRFFSIRNITDRP